MRQLLDTPVLLGALAEPARLGPATRSAITERATVVEVSSISAWEISIGAVLVTADRQVARYPVALLDARTRVRDTGQHWAETRFARSAVKALMETPDPPHLRRHPWTAPVRSAPRAAPR